MIKKMFGLLIIPLAVLLAGETAFGAVDPEAEMHAMRDSADSPIRLGVWHGDLDKCKAYAEQSGIPMVAIWSNKGCSHCKKLLNNILTEPFQEWQKDSGLILCFTSSEDAKGRPYGAWFNWCWGPNEALGAYPFVKFYWKKDGKVLVDTQRTGDTVDKSFGNKPGDPAKDPDAGYNRGGRYASQYIAKMFPDYVYTPVPEYAGGYFSIGSTNAFARLETIKTTDTTTENTVYVPLHRDAVVANVATNQTLKVSGIDAPFSVDWEEGATNQFIELSLSNISADISLTLLDGTNEVDTTTIFAIDADYPNSAGNPKFTGAEPGVWTMDLDAVTNATKIATGPAYTLAVVGGCIWCPFCLVSKEDWLNSDVFKNYVNEKGLYLVAIDNTHMDKKTGANPKPPSLLSYDSNYEDKSQLRPAGVYSGAAYLSRNQISPETAKAISDRNWNITCKDWVLPDGERLGLPTFVLLRKDGSIVGRVPLVYTGDPKQDNLTWYAEAATQRIADLIACDTPFEEKNNFIETTTAEIALQATGLVPLDTPSNTISASDLTDTWKIVGKPGVKAEFSISAVSEGEFNATLSIVEKSADGTINTLASATGAFAATIKTLTVNAILTTNDCFLVLKGDKETTFSAASTASTVCKYNVEASISLIPTEAKQTFELASGTQVSMTLKNDTLYRITGNIEITDALETIDAENSIYKALQDAVIVIKNSSAATVTVEYQIWKPGKVAFVKTAYNVNENGSTGKIQVTRSEGSSGKCDVTLTINPNNTDTAVKGERYDFADIADDGTTFTFTWADGETGVKELTYALIATPAVLEGTQQFSMGLSAAEDCAAEISEDLCTVEIYDTDDPVFDSNVKSFTLYTGIEVEILENVYNIKNERKTATLKRIGRGSLPSGISAKYDAKLQSLVISGTPKKAGEYSMTYAMAERRPDGTVTGPETVFNFTVVDTKTLNENAGTTIRVNNIPCLDFDGYNALCGLANVTISSTGRVTAKISRFGESKTLSFSATGFSQIGTDEEGYSKNALYVGMENRDDMRCEIMISATGELGIAVGDNNSDFLPYFIGRSYVKNPVVPADYEGYYTVTMETSSKKVNDIDTPSGTGYLALTLNDRGSVRYSGIYPNGKTVSGSTTLQTIPEMSFNDDNVEVAAFAPVLKTASADSLAVNLEIKKDAQENHTINRWSVRGTATWKHKESRYKEFSFEQYLTIYGGFYDSSEDLMECCTDAYSTALQKFFVDKTGDSFGDVDVGTDTMKIKDPVPAGKLRLTFKKKTGLFNGSLYALDNAGKAVRMTYKGILLPGWGTGCDECGVEPVETPNRPFGSGTAYYNETINGVKFQQGLSVDIMPKLEFIVL